MLLRLGEKYLIPQKLNLTSLSCNLTCLCSFQQIKVVLEVRDREHGLQVKEALQLQYPNNVLWGLDSGSTASTS